jgi:signal peptidase I
VEAKSLTKRIVITLLCLLVVTAVLMVVGFLTGWSTEVVLSGSMEPAISTGSVVVVSPVDVENIHVGDIISFTSFQVKIIHRVAEIQGSSPIFFVTKGDANRDTDFAMVPAQNVHGKVVLSIPFVGYLISFLKTIEGIGAIILVIGLLYFGNGLLEEMRNKKKT